MNSIDKLKFFSNVIKKFYYIFRIQFFIYSPQIIIYIFGAIYLISK